MKIAFWFSRVLIRIGRFLKNGTIQYLGTSLQNKVVSDAIRITASLVFFQDEYPNLKKQVKFMDDLMQQYYPNYPPIRRAEWRNK